MERSGSLLCFVWIWVVGRIFSPFRTSDLYAQQCKVFLACARGLVGGPENGWTSG